MSLLASAVFFLIGWALWTYTIGTVIHEAIRPHWWDEHPGRRLPVAALAGFWVMSLLTAAVIGLVTSA